MYKRERHKIEGKREGKIDIKGIVSIINENQKRKICRMFCTK